MELLQVVCGGGRKNKLGCTSNTFIIQKNDVQLMNKKKTSEYNILIPSILI